MFQDGEKNGAVHGPRRAGRSNSKVTMLRARIVPRLTILLLCVWLMLTGGAGCRASAAPAATSTPHPSATATPLPPPRPTAAPPALSPPSPEPSPAAALTPRPWPRVRVGHLRSLADSGLYIGLAEGFFAEQRLDIVPQEATMAADLITALRQGRLDAATLPIDAEFFRALAAGLEVRIVAEATGAPPGHGAGGLLVRPELVSRLRTPTDLRDLRIAVPARGHALEAELAALLRQGWLAPTDVRTEVVPTAELAARLAAGTLDAALVPEPDLTALQERGIGSIWRRSDQMLPGHMTAALVFSTRFSQQEAETARHFATAYLKALRLYNDVFIKEKSQQRGRVAAILSANVRGIAPADLERIVLPGMNPNGMVNIQTLRFDQRYFLASELVPKEVDLAAFVDTQFAAYAITQLGEYRSEQSGGQTPRP